jgi:NAD(P)H-hydrate epimerase
MLPVLSRAQVREVEAHAIRGGVPSLVLMENAGRGAVDVLERELCRGRVRGVRIVVVAGTGNNGGDGLVAARHLAARGAQAIVVMAGREASASPEARANADAWRSAGGKMFELTTGGPLIELVDAIAKAEVVVDGLFGTGLSRPIEGWYGQIIDAINRADRPCLAIDVPSGLDADTGVTLGTAVRASVTATFGHHKLGLLTPNGALLGGKIHLVGIGIPPSFSTPVGSYAQQLERSDVRRWLAHRVPGAHKNSSGHVLVVGGAPGRVGAPQLVALGAMRSGAGLTTIATWPHVAQTIEAHILETMTARIEREDLIGSVDRALEGKQAVVVGPGFGLDHEARTVVEYLLATWQGPVVVDADALSMFSGRPSVLMATKNPILTPHPGEMGRLLDRSARAVEDDRVRAARELVAVTGAVVVLKGAHTIVAAPDSRLAISPIACPALATAGSGDLLSGIIGAMACKLESFEAACAGVMLHAMAGEAWSVARGGADRGLIASDIATLLPTFFGDE